MRRCVLLLVVGLVLTVTSPVHASQRAERPDLTIRPGSLTLADGGLVVRLTLVNTGLDPARPSLLTVSVDGVAVGRARTGWVRRGQPRKLRLEVAAPGIGTHDVTACADVRRAVRERREGNNCKALGQVTVPVPDSFPSDPISYTADRPKRLGTGAAAYWVQVPSSYDGTHRTPIPLVVFAHGCGDDAAHQLDDLRADVDLGGFVTMVPELGRDGACWDYDSDPGRLRAAIADLRTHLNIDPTRLVLGGYSSGALLTARTALADAPAVAGLMLMMGSPFLAPSERDPLLGAATARFPVAWRAHTGDTTFPIGRVRSDQQAMVDAGFPLVTSEVGGTHEYVAADLAWLFSQLGALAG